MRRRRITVRRIWVLLATTVPAASVLTFATAAPAGATLVTNEPELRNAFANDATVELANDITLVDCPAGAITRTINDAVVLDGQGHTLTQTCGDSVVRVDGTGAITAQNITITGGRANNNGGGIVANGQVTILDSAFVRNHANLRGGGIGSEAGPIIVERSLFDSNDAAQGGAAINGGPDLLEVRITDSMISNGLGGSVFTLSDDPSGSVTFVNSTVTNNRNVALGGGVSTSGTVTLVYSTFADNEASQAFDNIFANVIVSFGSVVLGGSDTGINNCGGTTTSQGYNYSDDNSCDFTDPTDRQGQPPGSALLGPIAFNGGPTPTLLPGEGSPLIDAIPVAACQTGAAAGITTDQRGVARPQAGGCDIGAVEVVPAAIVLEPTFTG